MNHKVQRFSFAILVGIVLNLLFTFFIQIACWGPAVSVLLAAYLARAATPKEGAVTGAFVFLPSSAVLVIQTIRLDNPVDSIGLPLTLIAAILALLTGIGLGGLFGLVIGKLFQVLKDRIVF